MTEEMTCTQCGRPAGAVPNLSEAPVEVVAELCRRWLCTDCLDEDEDKHRQFME